MSTRANIVVKDGIDELWFYRHSDGYPQGAMPLLQEFVELIKSKKIRDNISQASGWLIMLGAQEYQQSVDKMKENKIGFSDWKVGSIEPTTGQHGDIEYLYTVDLPTKTIIVKEINL